MSRLSVVGVATLVGAGSVFAGSPAFADEVDTLKEVDTQDVAVTKVKEETKTLELVKAETQVLEASVFELEDVEEVTSNKGVAEVKDGKVVLSELDDVDVVTVTATDKAGEKSAVVVSLKEVEASGELDQEIEVKGEGSIVELKLESEDVDTVEFVGGELSGLVEGEIISTEGVSELKLEVTEDLKESQDVTVALKNKDGEVIDVTTVTLKAPVSEEEKVVAIEPEAPQTEDAAVVADEPTVGLDEPVEDVAGAATKTEVKAPLAETTVTAEQPVIAAPITPTQTTPAEVKPTQATETKQLAVTGKGAVAVKKGEKVTVTLNVAGATGFKTKAISAEVFGSGVTKSASVVEGVEAVEVKMVSPGVFTVTATLTANLGNVAFFPVDANGKTIAGAGELTIVNADVLDAAAKARFDANGLANNEGTFSVSGDKVTWYNTGSQGSGGGSAAASTTAVVRNADGTVTTYQNGKPTYGAVTGDGVDGGVGLAWFGASVLGLLGAGAVHGLRRKAKL